MSAKRPRAIRAEFAHFHRLQTRWTDNDVFGHMNNTVHYTLFDTVVNNWLINKGLLQLQRSQTFGLVVETGCRYHAEIAFPAPVDAGLRVGKIGNSSVRYEIGLFAVDDDQALAEGFFVHVNVDRDTHRPSPLEPNKRQAMESLMLG